MAARVDLYWLPLGAGGRSVRLNGRVYEAVAARRERRRPLALYHAALAVSLPEGEFVVEMAPAFDRAGDARGVVAEGPVGSAALGRLRLFRYEVRRWRDGVIPDLDEAVQSPVRLSADHDTAQRLLDLVAVAPTHVWGRDALGAGDMWNSNSLVAWLLARSGVDADAVRPPAGGRAPGWRAGLVAAASGSGAALAEPGGVLTAQVERDAEQQRPRPHVHGVEGQRLVVADQRRDQPHEEPDQGHSPTVGPGRAPRHPQSAAMRRET
jgi:hypothetical protein